MWHAIYTVQVLENKGGKVWLDMADANQPHFHNQPVTGSRNLNVWCESEKRMSKKWKNEKLINSSLLHPTSSRHLICFQSSIWRKKMMMVHVYLHTFSTVPLRADMYQACLRTPLSLHDWRRTDLMLMTQATCNPYQNISLLSKILEHLICMRINSLDAKLFFCQIPVGADLFFEPGKRRDPSRAFMPVTKKVLEINKKCKE